jgi:hypothetical protein
MGRVLREAHHLRKLGLMGIAFAAGRERPASFRSTPSILHVGEGGEAEVRSRSDAVIAGLCQLLSVAQMREHSLP